MLPLLGCVASAVDQTAPAVGAGRSLAASPESAIKSDLSNGPGITALLNKNYNEDTAACTEWKSRIARGLYYCSGVLIKGADKGNATPWAPSPAELNRRTTSYSWIRHDLRTTTSGKDAGYILLNPADIISGAVPGMEYLTTRPSDGSPANTAARCVYPYEALTGGNKDSKGLGCNVAGVSVGEVDAGRPWGSCDDGLKLTTTEQWDSHFNAAGMVSFGQCSWNADNAQGWLNMIASHNAGPGKSSGSEVLMYNFGPTPPAEVDGIMRKWIVAFFYNAASPASLADAQEFQRKLASAGNHVPVVKIDFKAPAAERFAFNAADQVAGAYP